MAKMQYENQELNKYKTTYNNNYVMLITALISAQTLLAHTFLSLPFAAYSSYMSSAAK